MFLRNRTHAIPQVSREQTRGPSLLNPKSAAPFAVLSGAQQRLSVIRLARRCKEQDCQR